MKTFSKKWWDWSNKNEGADLNEVDTSPLCETRASLEDIEPSDTIVLD